MPDPGPRCGLWSCRASAAAGNGHSRTPDRASITLAKRLCGAAGRFHPPGMPRSYHRARRSSPSPYPQNVCQLLQRRADSSIAEEGRSLLPLHRAGWTSRFDTDPWWPAPSVLPDIVSDRDKGVLKSARSGTGSDMTNLLGSSLESRPWHSENPRLPINESRSAQLGIRPPENPTRPAKPEEIIRVCPVCGL